MVNVPSPSLLQKRKVLDTRGLEAMSLGQPAGATSTTSTKEVWASKLRTTAHDTQRLQVGRGHEAADGVESAVRA